MPSKPPPLGPKSLNISDPARRDMDEALAYIAREAGLEVALSFAERVDRELHALARSGHSGVARDWISPGLRMTLIANYCVYFRPTPAEINVVRFLHGARDVDAIVFDGDC